MLLSIYKTPVHKIDWGLPVQHPSVLSIQKWNDTFYISINKKWSPTFLHNCNFDSSFS